MIEYIVYIVGIILLIFGYYALELCLRINSLGEFLDP